MDIERGVPELPLAEGRGQESTDWLAELEESGETSQEVQVVIGTPTK